MSVSQMIEQIKQSRDAGGIGMILTHVGLVRDFSRDGRAVSGLRVEVDRQELARVLSREKKAPGIFDIRVEIEQDKALCVGDEIMRLVVAGDIREHVIPALERTLSAIKETVTHKTEY
ncbi:MAG: molybdenum cofactor biosynthesis protein MoaE [Desulfosalsimonadaceae bacterium]